MKRQSSDVKEEFLLYLKNLKGYSENTIRAYSNDLAVFEEYLKRFGINSLVDERINLSVLRRFIALQSSLGASERTLLRRIACLKSFFKWAKREGLISSNPAQSLSTPQKPQRLPEFLTERETEIIFEDYTPQTPKDYRDMLMFKIMYGLGLRISEVLNLKLDDISFSNATVRVTGKGSKQRLLPVPEKLLNDIQFYIHEIRPELNPSDNRFLFTSRNGKKISDTAVRKNLRKLLLKIGLSSGATPHTFRHSIATHLLARGVDIRIVQEILGHSSLNSTQVYTHADVSWLQRVYDKSHPRARLEK